MRSQKNRLRLQPHITSLFHIILYRCCQLRNLLAAGATAIDQYECLIFIYARSTGSFTFPAALIDQPAGGQLDAAVRLRMADQLRIGREQNITLCNGNYRILEETAGIADHGRSEEHTSEL